MDLLDETVLQSPEAETALLGAVAFAPDALAGVLATLPAEDFYNPHRAAVWERLRARSADRRSLAPAAVARDLASDGRLTEAIRHVVQVTMSNAQPAHYAPEHARTVADLARRRELVRAIKAAYVTVRDFPGDHSEILARVRSVFDDLGGDEQRLGGTKTWAELLDEFDAEHAPDAEPTSIPTPWVALDDLIGGLFPGRMYVIGGMAGSGKSTLAINIAAQAAQLGHAALIFSKEMPTIDVTGRLVAYGAGVNLARLNARRLDDTDRTKAREFATRTAAWRMRVNADPVTLTGVKHLARALHHRGQLDLLVVDYLQLMTGDKPGRTAQEEIAQISTGLKGLAMELAIPVVVPAQLNRAPAARPDGRPTKSDLRECLTGDTLITRADSGQRVPIAELVGHGDIPIWTVDEGLRLKRGVMSDVWATGEQETFAVRLASGRSITATANHPFMTVHGWQTVEALRVGECIATPRAVPQHSGRKPIPEHEVVMLAHLLGDGCVTRAPIYYCSRDEANLVAVEVAAAEFGVTTRRSPGRGVTYLHFPMNGPSARGRTNPLYDWVRRFDLWGRHAWEKHVPDYVFSAGNDQIRLFLRHLWATDGSVTVQKRHSRPGGREVSIYYATTSRRMADDVQALLLRIGIKSRLRAATLRKAGGRQGWSVYVSGRDDMVEFLTSVRVNGERGERCVEALNAIGDMGAANPNVGTIPKAAWDYVRKAMRANGITFQKLSDGLGATQRMGAALFKRGLSRDRMARVAAVVSDPYLRDLAESDVEWDQIAAIEAAGLAATFDARVPGTNCFVANDIVSHNSGRIEQDSDVVILLWRKPTENLDTGDLEPDPHNITLIVDKNRHGPTGEVLLPWHGGYGRVG